MKRSLTDEVTYCTEATTEEATSRGEVGGLQGLDSGGGEWMAGSGEGGGHEVSVAGGRHVESVDGAITVLYFSFCCPA